MSGYFRKKKINFTMVSNSALDDETLSLKAQGLYAKIQRYITIEGFKLYKNTLIKKCSDGETSFRSAWNELKDRGYLKQYKMKDSSTGKWIYEYDLLDEPDLSTPALVIINKNNITEEVKETEEKVVENMENPHVDFPHVDFPHVDFPHVDFPHVENDPVYNNTYLNNTYLNNTNQINTKSNQEDLSFLLRLIDNEKINYLENKFDFTNKELMTIIYVIDLGVEDGTIKSEKGSNGYWSYVYKTCKSRYEKKLTHNGRYELAN